jgi:maleylpyruvate isomerase
MDPEITADLARIEAATGRLLATIATLTGEQAREPSLLPGWTRGHVLTHIARNADGLANVARSVRTGTEIPMYASDAGRDADVEAGAGRPAAALLADVRESAAAFAHQAGLVPAGAWTALVRRTPGGEQFPASSVPVRRLGEVEVHHTDLGLGYRPGDWPGDFVDAYFPRVADSWAGRPGAPACLLSPDGTDHLLPVGPATLQSPAPIVAGPAADLLAWLTGRGDGSGLRVRTGEPLPVLPAWR